MSDAGDRAPFFGQPLSDVCSQDSMPPQPLQLNTTGQGVQIPLAPPERRSPHQRDPRWVLETKPAPLQCLLWDLAAHVDSTGNECAAGQWDSKVLQRSSARVGGLSKLPHPPTPGSDPQNQHQPLPLQDFLCKIPSQLLHAELCQQWMDALQKTSKQGLQASTVPGHQAHFSQYFSHNSTTQRPFSDAVTSSSDAEQLHQKNRNILLDHGSLLPGNLRLVFSIAYRLAAAVLSLQRCICTGISILCSLPPSGSAIDLQKSSSRCTGFCSVFWFLCAPPRLDSFVQGLDEEGEEETVLGRFTYTVKKDPPQTFPLQNGIPRAFRFLKLVIQSNWGKPGYTCIYRVQVHGKIVEANDTGQAGVEALPQ
ncbi:hypothetical protein Q9233_016486 [Columba guinea]|nr:hypothetical protein Q9233_016486 [Columba guinea]